MSKVTIVLVIAFVLGLSTPLIAQGLGIGLGPSIPMEGPIFKDKYKTGFNVGLKAKWGGDAAKFVIGASYVKFSSDKIVNPGGVATSFTNSLNILPQISVGGQLTVLPLGPLSAYVAADAEYNRITSTIDYDVQLPNIPVGPLPIPIAASGTLSRVGAAAGVGVEFNLAMFTVDVSAKYHALNLIGKTDEEDKETICFVNLNLTLFFAAL
jgi:hypothetical protein